MRIEFVREWGIYRPGQTVGDLGGGVADVLVRRGIARPAVKASAATTPAPAKPKKVTKRG